MKDALGHGSNKRGSHAAGVAAIGQRVTRYHTTKREYWEKAKKTGFLNPNSYTTKKIWTSTHPDEYYSKRFDAPFRGTEADEVELEITADAKHFLPTPGNENGGSADRVTKAKIPVANIREVQHTLPTREEYAKTIGLQLSYPSKGVSAYKGK